MLEVRIWFPQMNKNVANNLYNAYISRRVTWTWKHLTKIQSSMSVQKWAWVRHTLRRSKDCIARQALGWNPQGSRRRGRPCDSWRRDTDHTTQSRGLPWHQLEHLSRDRGDWRDFVSGLCSEMEWERLQNPQSNHITELVEQWTVRIGESYKHINQTQIILHVQYVRLVKNINLLFSSLSICSFSSLGVIKIFFLSLYKGLRCHWKAVN